ncbi:MULTISPECIES: MCE family protein [unclassified Streptomyces]|uniref:MCE family protein n=1 Tax=unclassified Streptomyces TaxID=2593676 RepID=UPI0022535655|nr:MULTISPECIES: MCE family protein [unclassified Streptomyces]MCX5062329.1 MCE family protein [Streptomyces sp. NBC_00452]MCX5292063.1 MCE family protein [Streptomyces sp. NBC_00183]
MRVLRLRLYGLVFIVVLAVLLSLSVAVYRQVFTPAVRITLEADSLGNQLDPRADVKLRGLLVGEVRSVHADGTKAILDIALKPQYADDIPSDVRARLLPKTLFGEKYVDLVAPAHTAHASARPIRAGDVIPQDRTRVGIEVQQLMNDLLPLLRTVRPGKLNATLSAFATALEGRGDRIGDNLTRVEDYLHRLNPHLPSLTEDFARLADVAKVYGDAAPDLMEILRNTVTTSRTLVEQQDRLASALTTTATAADTADDFLGANGDRLISLGRVSRPTLELFARYSPEYPCLLAGLVHEEQASDQAFRGGRMHITLEVVRQQGAYEPGEEPRYGDRSGPDCRDLPSPSVPAPGVQLNDGSRKGSSSGPLGVSATRSEQRAVGSLVSPVLGVPADEVPPVATLLFGPMARGTAVSVA